MAKNSKNIFLFFSRPSASFSYIITIYIDQISKNRFLGRFGAVWPKFRILGFFGKNPAVSVISKYHPQSPCRVSETSYTPFSGTLKAPNQHPAGHPGNLRLRLNYRWEQLYTLIRLKMNIFWRGFRRKIAKIINFTISYSKGHFQLPISLEIQKTSFFTTFNQF